MRRSILVACLLVAAPAHAQQFRAISASRSACDVTIVTVTRHDVTDQPQPIADAPDCAILLVTDTSIQLPRLVNDAPMIVTVRNIGHTPITVYPFRPDDVINGVSVRLSMPRDLGRWPLFTPIMCCGDASTVINPQAAETFAASPRDAPNSWFTTSARR
jgi:hypothetical protein